MNSSSYYVGNTIIFHEFNDSAEQVKDILLATRNDIKRPYSAYVDQEKLDLVTSFNSAIDNMLAYTLSESENIQLHIINNYLTAFELFKENVEDDLGEEEQATLSSLWRASLPLLQAKNIIQSSPVEVGVTIEDLEEKSAELLSRHTEELDAIKQEIINESDNLKILRDNIQSDIKHELKIAMGKISALSDNFINNINYNINDIEQASIKRMSSQSSERLEELKKVQDGALQSFNGAIDDRIDSISGRIDTEVSAFESKKIALENVIGAIGGASMSHEHKEQARQEFRAFVFFQLTGFIMLMLAIASTLTIFGSSLGFKVPMLESIFSVVELTSVDKLSADLTTSTEPSSLVWFLQRISLVLLLTAPGIFLLKEATIHRQKENLYRQRGIQLAAIEPFIDEFPDDEKVKIKKELVKNFFTFHDGKSDTKNVPDFIRDMKEAVGIAKSINAQTKTVSQRFNRKAK
ncbi:hypothetical protein [Vibrio sp. OPT24]|uniref:hypothetical protein n=1 Tax=Vibrio sp. OPT24 TaxID=2778643 RepID=UPI0018815E8E|nr:hypothetical protein [Vibrio sp. OPT24]MBE8557938.1 hypothetical protein [Vibrio sp. OPT24]